MTNHGWTSRDTSSDPSDSTVDIADRVLHIARTDPGRVALIHARQGRVGSPTYDSHTYGELSRRAESLAVGLRGIGLKEGSLCSFMVPPCFDSLVLGVALWRIGAVTVGIEPHSHGLKRVAKCLDKVGPEFFFGTPRAHAARIAFGWGRGSVSTNVMVARFAPPGMPTLNSLVGEEVPEPVPAAVLPQDPTVIAFTTGSTGDPKPTVLRQRNFAALIRVVMEQWQIGDDGPVVDMPTFPMFWIIGLSVGGTVVVPPMEFTVHGPGDADPARLIRTIEDCGVRSMFASPALLANLAAHASDTGRRIASLRRVVAGGAEIQGPLFEAVLDVLEPGAEMYSDYGATEALPVSEISGATVVGETWKRTIEGEGVCAGTPLPGVQIRIIASTEQVIESWSEAEPLENGQVGEIVARSPHISEDYYRSPQATAHNKIPDGPMPWHRIGDLGYLDDEGRLWLCGRKSHRVVTEEGVLYPLRCEPVFNAHPGVARSALVGVEHGGHTVPTICVERTGPDLRRAGDLEAELLGIAARHDSTRLIERVVFMKKLPVDQRHNAKIDRPGIAAALSDAWSAAGITRSVEVPTNSTLINMLK